FTLKKPNSTFVSHLIGTGIVPKHAYGDGYAENPIGSGPYQFVQWDKGQQVIVEVNDGYYGEMPYFQKLTFVFLSEDASYAAARTGAVDVAYLPSSYSQQSVAGKRLEAIQTVDNRGIMF